MSGMKFEQKMVLLARKYGLHLTLQDLKYGYRRARFICGSHEEMTAIKTGCASRGSGKRR